MENHVGDHAWRYPDFVKIEIAKIAKQVCFWRTDSPVATKSKSGKISESYILTPLHPRSKCEQPLDEPTVQVWLLYHFICRQDRITDRQTNKQTDDPITEHPWWTFQAGTKIYFVRKYMYFWLDCHKKQHLQDLQAEYINVYLLLLHLADSFLFDFRCNVGEPQSRVTVL